MSLTKGAIYRAYNNETVENPVVQIIDVKKIGNSQPGTADRYRLVISDSVHYQQAMLTTQLNPLIENGQLQKFSVITLTEFIVNSVANRRIIIVLQLDMQSQPNAMIGSPSNVDAATAPAAPAPAAAAPQQHSNYSNNSNNYGDRKQAAPQRNPNEQFHPISSLNPYRTRWTIKARVTVKGDMRTWQNAKGEGKLFSVDLLDNEGGQIKATMFGEAADKFYPIFQQDKVYVISKGQLKLANKRFNRLPNDYEITLNQDAEVEFFGEDASIGQQKFDFVSIERIQAIEPEEFIDLVGVATAVTPIATLISKNTQRELKKRTVTLTDQSLMAVDLTLWGEQAEKFNEDMLANNPIFAAKALKVSDFGGRSLNSSFGSVFLINPDIKEAHDLRSWYDQKGSSAQVTSMSVRGGSGSGNEKRVTFSTIKEEQLGFKEKPDYISIRGTITFFQHDADKPPWYNACPTPKCNKKVTLDEGSNQWFCEKCSQSYSHCDPRFILRFVACDGTSSEWLTAFDEVSQGLLGRKAAELNDLKDEDRTAFETAFADANFKQYIFTIRVKAEQVQDSTMVKCQVIKAAQINFKTESKFLLDEIASYG